MDSSALQPVQLTGSYAAKLDVPINFNTEGNHENQHHSI